MATLEHSRYKVFSKTQHLLTHDMSEFQYSNPSAPDVMNVEDALNFIFKVLYPQTNPSVDWETDQGDGSTFLPLIGNSLGDYRNVMNGYTSDGGVTYKTAGFMWAKFDGETDPSWHMTTVFDWGTDDVASVMIDRTKLLYYFKLGLDDIDKTGDDVGQWLYGGATANTHLTLNANNGDATGHSGFIQLNDDTRPMTDNAFVLGEITRRFKEFYTIMAVIGNVAISGNTISTQDATKIIDFIDNEIATTGMLTAGSAAVDNINIDNNKITSDTGSIDFDNDDIVTTAKVTAGEVDTLFLNVDTTSIDNGVITDTDQDLLLDIDTVRFKDALRGQSFEATDAIDSTVLSKNAITSNTDVTISTTKTGGVFNFLQKIVGQAIEGTIATFTSLFVDDIKIDGAIVSSQTLDLKLESATGDIPVVGNVWQQTDNTHDLGVNGAWWKDLYLKGSIYGSAQSISIDELVKLRQASVGAVTGDSLFYDATTNTWKPSAPDSEIDHGTLNGLLDDDHTQYPLMAGRATGQTIAGGELSGVLALTGYNSGRAYIISDDSLYPNTPSVSDLGATGHEYKNIVMTGELLGGRAENVTDSTMPTPDVAKKGRLVYSTDGKALYVDNGTLLQRVGNNSYKNGALTATDLTTGVNVSSTITDARNCIWQVSDVDTGEEILGVTITKTVDTVTVSTDITLPAHTYRLIGVEA